MMALMKYWHFTPVTVAFIFALAIGYFFLIHREKSAKAWYFIVALLLIIICTCSPLHWLGENYLFSMHMISHVILFLIVPPLLVLSIPSHLTSRTKNYLTRISKTIATVPWLAWILGIGIMWFWHIPAIFDGAMPAYAMGVDGFLHHAQSISLVIVGLIFWWPVFGPLSGYRLPALKGILYLFTACISCSLLGLLITFSPVGMYSYYGTISDVYGFSSLIRNSWGMTPAVDHQVAGLIMWVPGCLIYLSGALYLLNEWFREKDELPVLISA